MANPQEKVKEPASAYEISQRHEERQNNAAKPGISASPVQPLRTPKSLSQNRLRVRQAGDLHNVWDASVERGHTIEDAMSSDYWKHVAVQLRTHDEIIAIEESGQWRAHLFVVGSDRLWAKVYKLQHHDLTESRENMPKTQEEEYEVTWTAIGKFAIIKKGYEGMPPLKDGFQTRLEAYNWLDGHLRTINQ